MNTGRPASFVLVEQLRTTAECICNSLPSLTYLAACLFTGVQESGLRSGPRGGSGRGVSGAGHAR